MAQVPDGMYFDGWYEGETKVSGTETYYFYAIRNMSIEPRFTQAAVEAAPVFTMNVSERQDLGNNKNKVSLTYDWELPEGYTLEKAAIVRSYVKDEPTISTTDTSVHYTSLNNARGTYKINLTMGATSSDKLFVFAIISSTLIIMDNLMKHIPMYLLQLR